MTILYQILQALHRYISQTNTNLLPILIVKKIKFGSNIPQKFVSLKNEFTTHELAHCLLHLLLHPI